MLVELFKKTKSHLDYFFERVDVAHIEKLFQIFSSCPGVIFFTGVGKSGLVAQKIAATMASTGTKALALSSMNALHGDIGIVSKDDVFVVLSKSGESEELLQLIPFVRNKGATLIAIVSSPNSQLARACDHVVVLPLEKELCPFDLAPTISTTAQVIFGDVLAIGLMQTKGFSLDQYALNHPKGQIGKRATFLVEDLMLRDEKLPLCKGEDHLSEVLSEFSNKKCGCLVIVDREKKLEGIFTDGDLRRSLGVFGGGVLSQPVKELMNKNPKVAHPKILAWEALKIMEENQKTPITILPVLDHDRKVVGVIKMHDLIQSGI